MVKWNMDKMYNYCKTNNLDLPEYNQKYIKNSSKYFYLCKYHGHYKQRWADHKRGQGCPICSKYKVVNNRKGKTARKSPTAYYNECLALGYDLPIEEYKGTHTKIKHKCSKCGTIYEQEPNHHLIGQGCFICKGNKKKSSDEYENECIERGLDLPIEPYINAKTKIKHVCVKNHVYKQTPNDHLQGYGCPKCKQSKGEKYIQNYLDKHNIHYIPQKKFNDLKDKRLLSYDFYLPEQKVLIEYQGEQHFESVSFSNKSKSDIQKQQYHDKLKYDYAINNGYTLLEPTFNLDTQEKVDEYLYKHLNNNTK